MMNLYAKLKKFAPFRRIRLLLLISLFQAFSCQNGVFARNSLPYALSARMTIENSEIYEIAGLEFELANKSDKEIRSFTLVFFVYDEDGNPPSIGSNNIVLEVTASVGPGKIIEDCASMDSFLYEIPDEPYQIDYLYVSKIIYADGSEWSDPFGMYAVN